MATKHIVAQGEHLSQIARKYGFASYLTIWNDGNNAELKSLRKNPNILLPDDVVFIPDFETREESKPADAEHKFEFQGEPLKVRIVLTDLKNKPMSGRECTLIIDSNRDEITTGGDGLLEKDIVPTAAGGKVLDRGTPDEPLLNPREIPFKIGHLDPIDTVSGQQARLNNLGYLAGDPGAPVGKPDEEDKRFQQFLSAVEEFQCDFGLTVDGVCGPNTQAKLKEAHGC